MYLSKLIIILSILGGIAGWFLEAFLQAYAFGEVRFIDTLILDVSAVEAAHRAPRLLLIIGFGLVVAAVQRARERGRRFHRAVVQAMGDGLVRVDMEGNLSWANDAFAEMLGRAPSDVSGRLLTDFATDDSQETLREILHPGEDQRGVEREVQFLSADGCRITTLTRCIVPKGGEEANAGCFCVVRDITDRRIAEDSIGRAEAVIRHLVEAGGSAAGLLAPDGTVLVANEAFARMLDSSVEDLEQTSIFDHMDEDVVERRRDRLEEIMRGGEPLSFQYRLEERWLEHHVYPVLDDDGAAIYAAVVAHDITERQEAELKLRQQARIIGQTQDIILVTDLEGKFVDVNTDDEAILGMPREQFLEMSIFDVVDRPREQEKLLEQIIETGSWRDEVVAPGADGEEFIFDCRTFVLEDEEGSPEWLVGIARDVTESRKTERKLRQQARIIEETHDIILITDLEGNIVDANQAEAEALGIPREDLLQMTVFDLGGDPAVQREILDQAVATGRWRGEVVNRAADGGERLLDCRVFLLEDEKGRPWRVVGISRDITARRRAEEQVEHALEQRRMIMDAMSEVILVQDTENTVIMANRAAAESLGMSEEEMIGRKCYELWGKADERCEGCPVNQTLRTGEGCSGEKTTPDGRVWEISADPVFRDGEMVSVVEVARDVTERRRQDKKIAELAQFRQSLIDQANIWVQVIDCDTQVLLWNPAAEEITGYSSDEVVGSSDVWRKLYPDPDYRRSILSLNGEIIEEGRIIEDLETPIRASDGTERIISWNSRRLIDPSGEPVGALAAGRDVTRRRQLEEQLRQSAKMEAVGRLAGGIAHDFNNLLTAILGNAELLANSGHHEVEGELIEEIRVAATRSADLVDQLLAFSRKQVIQPEMLDLNEIVAEIEPLLTRLLEENIAVVTNLDPDLGSIRADSTQIHQVLMNLVVNARDALPEGGRISIETENTHIDAAYAEAHPEIDPGYYAMLAVSDTGIGMDSETQKRIFEPFFTTRGRNEGTGLGLSTVYGIVKQSGGHITVYSEPDAGTTFKVYLPLIEDSVAKSAPEESLEAVIADRATILVVEDEEAVRRMIVRVLEAQGHEVLDASTGEEGIEVEAVHEGAIDLIVTDVVMPGMTGVEMAEAIADRRPETPVLFLSGYTDSALVHNGMVEAEIEYLHKPFAAEAFLRKVQHILRGHSNG